MISPLASRGGIGLGLATGGAAAAVAESWWLAGGVDPASAVAVYQPIGAASLAASYVNLANPGTYNAAPGVAPTWANGTGWGFVKTLGTYLKTNIVPSTGWTQIIRYAQTNSDAAALCESGDSTANGFGLRTVPGSNIYVILHGSGSSTGGPYFSSAVVAQAARQAYVNGVAQGALGGDATFTTSKELYIGGSNTAATPQLLFTGNIQAVAIYSATLIATQVGLISAAMAALA